MSVIFLLLFALFWFFIAEFFWWSDFLNRRSIARSEAAPLDARLRATRDSWASPSERARQALGVRLPEADEREWERLFLQSWLLGDIP